MGRKVDRREFLITTAVVGGGMALSLHYPEAAAQPSAFRRINPRPWLAPGEGGTEMDPWIVIAPDDRVLIRVNQSELGQGVMTSNPMMLVAGIIEFGGGLLIALGFLTSWAAFLASGQMAAAYFMVHAKGGFWPIINKGELAVVYCFLFLYIAARGAGPYSVDAAMRKR